MTMLAHYPVVKVDIDFGRITTYNQVQNSYPNLDPIGLSNSGKGPTEKDKARFDQQLGPLHRVKWYRIVLDGE